jgi:hypothetical protein
MQKKLSRSMLPATLRRCSALRRGYRSCVFGPGRGRTLSRAQLEPPRCVRRRTAFAGQRRTILVSDRGFARAPATSLGCTDGPRFPPSHYILESGRTTQWHYPEKSGFGRPTEREWGSPAATMPPEQENAPCACTLSSMTESPSAASHRRQSITANLSSPLPRNCTQPRLAASGSWHCGTLCLVSRSAGRSATAKH